MQASFSRLRQAFGHARLSPAAGQSARHRDIALKLQFESVRPRGGSRGTLINSTPAFRSDRTTNVTSIALDFVF